MPNYHEKGRVIKGKRRNFNTALYYYLIDISKESISDICKRIINYKCSRFKKGTFFVIPLAFNYISEYFLISIYFPLYSNYS